MSVRACMRVCLCVGAGGYMCVRLRVRVHVGGVRVCMHACMHACACLWPLMDMVGRRLSVCSPNTASVGVQTVASTEMC